MSENFCFWRRSTYICNQPLALVLLPSLWRSFLSSVTNEHILHNVLFIGHDGQIKTESNCLNVMEKSAELWLPRDTKQAKQTKK